jgi:anhydro-N-acetylmuramic acid kinase
MIYRVIGIMSGSSLDGLDIAFVELTAQGGKWSVEIKEAACYPYSEAWRSSLLNATSLPAKEYLLLHTAYGHYLGQQVNTFIQDKKLQYQVALIASHGHTTFHLPAQKTTAQLGDGAAIAAVTGLPVVTDLRALDVALGGQGAPIVPLGEKLLLPTYDYFLNIGGIANVSITTDTHVAYDVCPANKVLNMLANDAGKEYDKDGELAAAGAANMPLLNTLNNLDYYHQPYPKSLANDFGMGIVYPLIKEAQLSIPDALRTFTEHIAYQVFRSLQNTPLGGKLLVTGGGAFNLSLVNSIKTQLHTVGTEVIVPDTLLVNYKEAMIMALLGVLRWREENTTLQTVTGAIRNSVGGALWMGQEG